MGKTKNDTLQEKVVKAISKSDTRTIPVKYQQIFCSHTVIFIQSNPIFIEVPEENQLILNKITVKQNF
jgi:hypothetical protein